MSEQGKRCSPGCTFFRCSKHAMSYHGSTVHCIWTDDECIGPACNYALCSRNQLLPDGTCGLTVKRRTIEEEEIPEESIPRKMKSKILRRIKDEELI